MVRCSLIPFCYVHVHHFRATLRKAPSVANLDPRPILVSQWPARMLAPFPARRAYIQPGLELDEDCGSDVFYYFLAEMICRESGERREGGKELSGGPSLC